MWQSVCYQFTQILSGRRKHRATAPDLVKKGLTGFNACAGPVLHIIAASISSHNFADRGCVILSSSKGANRLFAGLGGLPWRTEALGEALLHLDSWSGWFHRSNGREVVRTLIAEASPTELNHMVSGVKLVQHTTSTSH